MYNASSEQIGIIARGMKNLVFMFSGFFLLIVTGNIWRGNVEAAVVGTGITAIWIVIIAIFKTSSDEREELSQGVWQTLSHEDTLPNTIKIVLVPALILSLLGAFTINKTEGSDFANLPFLVRIGLSFLALSAAGLLARYTYLTFKQLPYSVIGAVSSVNQNNTSDADLSLRQENEDLKAQLDKHRESLSSLANQFNERGREIERLEKAARGAAVGHYSALDIGEIERNNAILEQQLGLIRAKHRLDTRSTMPKVGGNLCRSLAKFEAAFGSDIKAVKRPDFQPYEELRADFSSLNKSIEGFNESLSKVSGPVRTKVYQGYVSNVLAPAVENAREFIGGLVREYHSDTSKHQISEADRTAVIMVLSDIRRSLKTVKGS